MATQKTTLRRYNSSHEWDAIYLATTGDITDLGTAVTLVGDNTAYAIGDTLAATDKINTLITRLFNRIATIDSAVIPGITAGTSITALAANKLTGTVSRDNLPTDVTGKVVDVNNEAERLALTNAQVNQGDVVKVNNGGVYVVRTATASGVTFLAVSDEAAHTDWSKIDNVPTTVDHTTDGTGGTSTLHLANVVLTGDLVATGGTAQTPNAGAPVKTDANGKLGFDITGDAATLGGHNSAYYATAQDITDINDVIGDTGTVPADPADPQSGDRYGIKGDIQTLQDYRAEAYTALNIAAIVAGTGTLPLTAIPKGALPEYKTVTSYAGLTSLTSANVQQGDVVQIVETTEPYTTHNLEMYYVKDETALGTMDAFAVFTSGKASSVEWTGVLNRPTSLAGTGWTDAVITTEFTTSTLEVQTGKAEGAKGKSAAPATGIKYIKLNSNGQLDVEITGSAKYLDGYSASYFATASALENLADNVVGHATDGQTAATGLFARIETLESSATSYGTRIGNIETAIGNDGTDSQPKTGIYKDIADLQAGTTISALNLNSTTLTGRVSRTNLPEDVGGKVLTYATFAAAKAAISTANANPGDLLKITGSTATGHEGEEAGDLYSIDDPANPSLDASYTKLVSPTTADVAWSQITGIPTVIGTGTGQINLTNALVDDDVVTEAVGSNGAKLDAAVGKLVAVHSDGMLHANVTYFGGQQSSYYATQSAVDQLSLNVPQIVNSVSELTNVEEGQLVLEVIS